MDVQRWRAAAVPWWVPKVVLVGGWAVAFVVVASVSARTPCTPDDPCTPSPISAVVMALLLGTPLLLLFGRVLTGCALGVLFGALDLVLDPGATSNLPFGIFAVACAIVAGWTVRSRADQHAAAGTGLTSLPDMPPPRGVLRIVAVLLVLFGFLTFVQYDLSSDEIARHVAAANRVDAEVVEIKDAAQVLVELPDHRRATLEPYAPEAYRVGDKVPVLEDGAWVRMVAEPEDVTWWLTLGAAAIFVAIMLAVREKRRRALWTGPVKAVRVQATGASGRRILLRSHDEDIATVAVLADLGVDSPIYHDPEHFGRVWRGEEERPVRLEPAELVVAGEWHHGGQVALVVEGEVVATTTLSSVRPRRGVHSAQLLPGKPVTATVPVELPHAVWPGERRRAEGAGLFLAAIGAAVALHYTGFFVFFLIGLQCVLSSVSRFQPLLKLDHQAVTLYTTAWSYRVPWVQLHGVRRTGRQLLLAFGPMGDVITTPHLPDKEAGEKVMWARSRSLIADHHGEHVTRKPNIGILVALAYAIITVLVV